MGVSDKEIRWQVSLPLPVFLCATHRDIFYSDLKRLVGIEIMPAPESTLKLQGTARLTPSAQAELQALLLRWQFAPCAFNTLAAALQL